MSDKPSIAELQRFLRSERPGHWRSHDGAIRDAVPVLLEISAAAMAWGDANCETKSPDTDDYIVADMNGECAGDTHHDSCPVARKLRALIDALGKVRP